MLDKYATIGADTSYFAPSVKELHYAQNNSKGVANLLLAALGISTAGYSAKRLLEGVASSRMSQEIQPSVSIQKKLRDATTGIDNAFLYSDKKMQNPFEVEEAEELARLLKEEEKEKKKEKKGAYKQALLDIKPSISVFNPEETNLKQDPLSVILANRRKAQFEGPLTTVDANKVLSHKDTTLSDRIKYDPKTLKTNSIWTKYISAPLAKMGPQSAVPLALALGGGLAIAPVAAKSLVSTVSKLVDKPKRESRFVEDAKEIYEEAAKELQDVGYKKEKDKDKKKKEAAYKYAEKSPIVSVTSSGGNPMLSAANAPTIALSLLLGAGTLKGLKGISKGMDKAKRDLSHQTQLLRGWKATNKLRDYNYNPITAELAEEPGLKTRTMREKNKRIKALLEDLKDSDEIEVNPLEVQRLSADYEELA